MNIPFRKIIPARRLVAPLVAAGVALLVASCTADVEEAIDDRPVIMVGTRTVTVEEYRSALDRVLDDHGSEAEATEEEETALKRDLVNRLVEEELILGEGGRLGVTVTDDEVSREVARLREESGDGSGFNTAVKEAYGSVEAWRAELGRKLLVRKVADRVVSDRVEVTEEDARAYYEDNSEEFNTPEMVRARMIVLADEEQARKVQRGLKPASFAAMAREFSLSPESVRGGDLGFFARGDMPVEFEEVVFDLTPGVVSDVVETPYGFHIFMVEEKRPAGEVPFEEARPRIVEALEKHAWEREFSEWVRELKAETKIVVKEDLL